MLEDRVRPDVDTVPTIAFDAPGDSLRKGVALELGRSAVVPGDVGLVFGLRSDPAKASGTQPDGSGDARRTGSGAPG